MISRKTVVRRCLQLLTLAIFMIAYWVTDGSRDGFIGVIAGGATAFLVMFTDRISEDL
jgi:hypothetical protein